MIQGGAWGCLVLYCQWNLQVMKGPWGGCLVILAIQSLILDYHVVFVQLRIIEPTHLFFHSHYAMVYKLGKQTYTISTLFYIF